MNTVTTPSIAAFDMSGLGQLKQTAKQDPKAALRATAEQFESLMLNQMMKSMRETVSDDEGLFSSQETKTFQGLLDQQWVTQMSKSKGFGIADMLVQQLGKNLPGAGVSSPAALQDTPQTLIPPALRKFNQRQDLPSDLDKFAAPVDLKPLAESRQSFIQNLLPHARKAAEKLGVAPELIVAHAALETGWGQQLLKGQQGDQSFNLFGRVAEARTTEYVAGVPQKQTEKFRAYESYDQAFDDYANLLSNSRFAGVKNVGSNSTAFANALQSGGYATDPNYAKKLQMVASQLLSNP
jgi:peptidoglycan hydrolase FlgJ